MQRTPGAIGHTRDVSDPLASAPLASDPFASAQLASAAESIDAVIRQRRTCLLVDPDAPIDQSVTAALIEAATWAPNHKRTWPWRFTVLTGAARGRLGDALANTAASLGMEPAVQAKLRTKYGRSPTVVLVWVQRVPDPVRAREDRDATAAGVQNLLLAATARGIASYWGSMPDALAPATREVCGVGDDHDLVALVYLGWPTGSVAVPARPGPVVTHLT